jgi:hypothetical protein
MRHPQADLILQVAQIRAEGMCEHWEYAFPEDGRGVKVKNPVWIGVNLDAPKNSHLLYVNFRMKPSHPDYNTDKNPNRPRPVLKQIDMSKLPVGTMTNHGEIVFHSQLEPVNGAYCLNALDCNHYNYSAMRLAKQVKWTAWLGGECPVPEGCEVRVVCRGLHYNLAPGKALEEKYWTWNTENNYDYDIIAYRITGVDDGWTDGSL